MGHHELDDEEAAELAWANAWRDKMGLALYTSQRREELAQIYKNGQPSSMWNFHDALSATMGEIIEDWRKAFAERQQNEQ